MDWGFSVSVITVLPIAFAFRVEGKLLSKSYREGFCQADNQLRSRLRFVRGAGYLPQPSVAINNKI